MAQTEFLWPGGGEMAARVRDFRWAATPLGSISSWPQSLRTTVDLVLALPGPATILWGPSRVQIYNDAYVAIAKDRHPGLLGQPVAEGWPDAFPDVIAPLLVLTDAGQATSLTNFPVELLGVDGRLEKRLFNTAWSPLRDEGGSVVGALQTLTEVTEIRCAQEALQASEARLAAAFEGVPVGVAVLDMAGRVVLANSEYRWFLPNGVIPSCDPERGWRWRGWDAEGRPLQPAQFPGARAMRGERVLPGQEMLFTSDDGREIWTRVATVPIRSADGQLVGQSSVISDIDAIKRSADALRESEARQAFLLELSDVLRPLSDPAEVQHASMKLLTERFDVLRAGYLDVHADGDTMTMAAHFERNAVSAPPQIRLSDYGPDLVAAFHAGQTRHVRDTIAEAETEEQRAAYRVLDVRAWIIAPLVKGGRLTAIVGVVSRTPRDWTPAEIQLVTDLAERTWDAAQRARSEQSLRESEERFAQFAASSADALWIRDAATLTMEYVSPAIASIYGVEPDKLLSGVEVWAAAIVPEDRDLALSHLQRAQRGEAVVHEFRIQRTSDDAFRWIRNTDFPLFDAHGAVQRIGGIAQDVTEAKLLAEHQGVLLAELQHRVRNIMGMIRSMANRTASGASSVEVYRSLLEGRLLALARVQALLTREANAGGSLRSVIASEIAAQAHHAGQYTLNGVDVRLSPKAVEVLTLAFHELATNALKYGALSVKDGHLTVSWTLSERRIRPWLVLDWVEEGLLLNPHLTRRGFGSELIEARIPYELGGRGKITIAARGAQCHLEFPLTDAESNLETDAPQPATVFGGMLDMIGLPDLAGRTILVVEDDYYLASDTAAVLRGAGAEVIGPCPNEETTRDLLHERTPTHAVLDLNLGGGGPKFEIARLLKARGVPFIFLTGYDPDVIPEDFAEIVRLQKPVPLRAVVDAVSQLEWA